MLIAADCWRCGAALGAAAILPAPAFATFDPRPRIFDAE